MIVNVMVVNYFVKFLLVDFVEVVVVVGFIKL